AVAAAAALTPEPAPQHAWREPTQILVDVPQEAPAPAGSAPGAPDDARTGTFVSELRRTMSAIEARLFGEGEDGERPRFDEGSPDIDLDSIGQITVPTMVGGPDVSELADL